MADAADFTVVQQGDVMILRFDIDNLLGILDVNRVGNALNHLITEGSKKVIFDMQMVRYAGSAALGMLLSIAKDLAAKGGKLVLCRTTHIDALLKVSRMRGVFDVALDPAAATLMF